MNMLLSLVSVLVIIFVVPIVVYSLFVKYAGLKEPEKKLSFFVSIMVQKIGTAVGFVALFAIGHQGFADQWLIYGLVWAAMFAVVEVGQAIGPDYSRQEAAAGIISELIYFPTAAVVVATLLA